MKKYTYKFSNTIIILLLAGIVVAVACLALNVYRFVLNVSKSNVQSFYDWLILIITIIITIGYISLAISMFLSSYYTVEKKMVILKWGFIKNKIDLLEVVAVKLMPKKKRLELIFEDESYFIIATKEEWLEDFVDDIRKQNSKIEFIQSTEEKQD